MPALAPNQQIEVACGACTGPILIELGPARLANTPEASLVVITHEAFIECPNCRETVAIVLASVQSFMFRTVRISRPQPQNLIQMPGNGFRPQ